MHLKYYSEWGKSLGALIAGMAKAEPSGNCTKAVDVRRGTRAEVWSESRIDGVREAKNRSILDAVTAHYASLSQPSIPILRVAKAIPYPRLVHNVFGLGRNLFDLQPEKIAHL